MKKLIALISLIALNASVASAQSISLSPSVAQQAIPQFSRCNSSIAISSSTAATSLLADGTLSSLGLHVCGYTIQIVSGTSPTFKLVYGTHTSANCDTGAVNVTGAFAATGVYSAGALGLQLNIPAGQQLCIIAGGTSPVLAGFVTYGSW